MHEVAGGIAGVRKKHDGRAVLECNKRESNMNRGADLRKGRGLRRQYGKVQKKYEEYCTVFCYKNTLRFRPNSFFMIGSHKRSVWAGPGLPGQL